jgi:ATP-dependent exoDNAse (exonuclease V) alpha subunit
LNGGKGLKKYNHVKYIFVDEVSMVRELFYKVLLTLKQAKPHIKFIICGDFFQLKPVLDTVSKSYEHSRVLYELVDGRMLTLTVCKRSDDVLFKICEKVKHGIEIDTTEFPRKKTMLNICFTNKTRKALNRDCMDRYISENTKRFIQVEKLHYDENSQDYTLMEGMPLIARVNKKSIGIVNNEVFDVEKIDKDSITVKNEFKTVVIPTQDISRTFNLGFARTTHKSQGDTFDVPYTIYEWRKMDTALRYVAISRANDIKNINIM